MCDRDFGIWLPDKNGISVYVPLKCELPNHAGVCQYTDKKSGCLIIQVLIPTVTVDQRGCIKEKP